GFEMVVADIPGLIEGAAEGKGLGHQFLRHIERARVLVLLLDLSPFAGASWQEQEATLLGELGDYRPDLVSRPRLRIGSRADLADPEVRASFDGLIVSAVTGEGVAQLVGSLRQLVEQARAEQPPPEGFVTLRPLIEGITISRNDDGSFNVEGREALRAVNLNDLTNPEAMDIARERLDKLGVDRSLGRAGARNGDVVHIGKLSFEFESDTDMVAQPFDEAPVRVVVDDDFSDLDFSGLDSGGADVGLDDEEFVDDEVDEDAEAELGTVEVVVMGDEAEPEGHE
ncbi:MAG TPA: Obg family GTPase CgtA, partial [Microthrixaceae bacterium]|nr:Obg family GTPase CgtA [Microthrixaceae bacterium]